MLNPDNFGARIAFVDYDGKMAFDKYKKMPPETELDEAKFVKDAASKMIMGIEKLKEYVSELG
jgi:aspartate aminotransferase